MKKNALAALLLIVMMFSAMFGLISCNVGTLQGNESKALSAPTNVKISVATLSWNPVENAVGYTVKIVKGSNASSDAVGDEYMVDSNSYSLEPLVDGEYTLFVKSRGDSVVWSSSTYSAGVNYTRKRDTGAEYEDDVVGAFGAFDEINTRESYLGYGVNIIDANGITSKNIKITYPIFAKDALLKEMLLKSNEHYSNLETIEAKTMEEFKKKLSNSASISAGSSVSASGKLYGMSADASFSLSAGLKTSFEHTSSETYSQHFLEIIAENQNYWLILQTQESRYREILSDEFKKDLYDNSITPAQLFDKYGTHLLTSVAMGGNITMFYTMYSYDGEFKDDIYLDISNSIKQSVDMVYGNYKGSAGDDFSFSDTFKYNEFAKLHNINIEKKIVTSGGSGSFGIINEQSLFNNYADWQKSLDAYPVVVGIKDSNSLYPIWNLIDTSVPGGAERYNELYSYFAEYGQDSYDSLCDTFGIKPPVAPTDIVNITAKNVYDYVDGETVQVKPGDTFKITFDVLPDNANKYKKTFSVNKNEYVTIDESGNVVISEATPSRTEFTVTVRAGTIERDIKFYVVQSCTVTFNTGFSELSVPNIIVESSSLINEPEILREGFVLEGWYKDAKYESRFDFLTDRVTANTMLYAKWSAVEPIVTFDSVGGSDVESQTLKYNTAVKEPANPYKDGYKFIGWYSNRSCTDKFDFSTAVKEDITLYAGWELIYYTVTFDTMGGVELSPKATNINLDYKIGEVIPARTYYEFGGWYRDKALANKFYFDEQIIEDITLYAKWTPIDVIVNLVDTDGTTLKNELGQDITSVTTNVEKNFLLSDVPVPAKTGYTFVGWKYNGEKIDHTTKEFVLKSNAEAYTIVAMWEEIDVAVSFTDKDGNPLINASGEEIGAAYTSIELGFLLKNIDTPVKNGYSFKAWTYNGEEIDLATMKFEPKANIKEYTLIASWTVVDVSVRFVDTDGNTLKNQIGEEIVAVSTNIEKDYLLSDVSSPVKTGYTFLGWKYNGELVDIGTQEFTPKSSGEAYTLVAEWTINEYAITYKINGETVKESSYKYNEKISPFIPEEKVGYTFSGWDSEPTVMPAEDVTVIGSFSINSYTLTYILDGVQYGDVETLKYGDAIVLRANPTDDHKDDFSGWTYNGNVVPATMPADNVIITGTFGAEYYNVNYYVDGELYKIDRVCVNNIIPTPEPIKTGYNFIGWSYENGDMISDITMMTAGDKVFKAVFEIKQITVTVKYVFENGTEAKASDSTTKNYGEAYSFTVGAIKGYTPDMTEVSGVAGEEDIEVKVTYKTNSYKLTVKYVDFDGTTVLDTDTYDKLYGTYYDVEQKSFTGRCNPAVTDTENGIMPAKDHTVTVKYELKSVNVIVNFTMSDGSTLNVSPITESHKYGESYSITVPTKTGYTAYFKGTTNKATTVSGTINTETNVVYNVEFTPNKYTLTVNLSKSDGNAVVIGDKTVTKQTESNKVHLVGYTYTIPTQTGYSAYLNGTGNAITTITYTVNAANPTYNIVYKPNAYTLTVNLSKSDGNAVVISGKTVTKQTESNKVHLVGYTYTIPTQTGYSAYLNGTGNAITTITYTVNAANPTYNIVYKPITYTVTYDDLNGSSILTTPTCSKSSDSVTYYATRTFAIPRAEYYEFSGWYDSNGIRITNENGDLIANVSGYTDSEARWIRTSGASLSARWVNEKQYSGYTYIGTPDQLKAISENTGAKYLIVKDIDMKGTKWEPIGTFSGIIDGKNHSVYNFYISNTGNGGSVGFIDNNNGTITNLKIGKAGENCFDGFSIKYDIQHNPNGNTQLNVGGIAGVNLGTINNCEFINAYVYAVLYDVNNDCTNYLRIGGITSHNLENATLTNCKVIMATIKGDMPTTADSGDDNDGYLGGICGLNYAKMENCAIFKSDLTLNVYGDGKWNNKAYPYGAISTIVGRQVSGSLKGCAVESTTAYIHGAYGGNTSPTLYAGSIIGFYDSGDVSECYAQSSVYITLNANGSWTSDYLVGTSNASGCNYYTNTSELPETIKNMIEKIKKSIG